MSNASFAGGMFAELELSDEGAHVRAMRTTDRQVKPIGAEDVLCLGALLRLPLRCKSSVHKDAGAAPQRGRERLRRSKSAGSERDYFTNLNAAERHMMIWRR